MKKLEVKDFITIGLFSALYLVVYALVITILGGIAPIIYFYTGSVMTFILGPVFMLFVSRTQKKYSVFIFNMIVLLVLWAMHGGMIAVLAVGIPLAAIAEAFASKGNYKNYKLNTISYVFFSLWAMSMYSLLWLHKEKMLEEMVAYDYGETYISSMERLISPGVYISIIISIIVMAILGSLLGRRLLKKHFIRAGIA